MQGGFNTSPEDGQYTGKFLHLALPVRWTLAGEEGRGLGELACTYDIHPRGARLLSTRKVSIGDLMIVERGRSKAVCQVVWTADSASPLRGQFTVRCIERRTPWDEELRQMEELYQAVISDSRQRQAPLGSDRPGANRRRRPRFSADGIAEVLDGAQRIEGEVQQLSEYGARIAGTGLLRPGTSFRLMLNLLDVTVALKVQVKHLADNLVAGVEFQKIRLGDRPLLGYVLAKLRTQKAEKVA